LPPRHSAQQRSKQQGNWWAKGASVRIAAGEKPAGVARDMSVARSSIYRMLDGRNPPRRTAMK
jgi:hypothetical protein